MNRRSFLKAMSYGGLVLGFVGGNALLLTYWRNRRRPGPQEDKEAVTAIAFSADGRRLASTARDGVISIWDPQTGARLSATPARSGPRVTSVQFLNNDSWLATLSDKDPMIQFWKPGEAKAKAFAKLASAPACAAFRPTPLVGITPPVWSIAVGQENHSISILQNGEYINLLAMSGGSTGTGLADFAETMVLSGHAGKVTALSYSRDGTQFASGSDDKTVRLWDTGTCREVAQLSGHQGTINSVSFSRERSRLASASDDGTIIIWDTQAKTQADVVRGHTGPVLNAVFSPDGHWLVSTAKDKTVLWSVRETSREGVQLPNNPGDVPAIDFSSDGRYVASAWGKEVKFWEAAGLIAEAKQKLGA